MGQQPNLGERMGKWQSSANLRGNTKLRKLLLGKINGKSERKSTNKLPHILFGACYFFSVTFSLSLTLLLVLVRLGQQNFLTIRCNDLCMHHTRETNSSASSNCSQCCRQFQISNYFLHPKFPTRRKIKRNNRNVFFRSLSQSSLIFLRIQYGENLYKYVFMGSVAFVSVLSCWMEIDFTQKVFPFKGQKFNK